MFLQFVNQEGKRELAYPASVIDLVSGMMGQPPGGFPDDVKRAILKEHPEVLTNGRLKDVAASYQEAAFDALLLRLNRAVERHPVAAVGCVGCVARNRRLREKLERLAKEHGVRLLLAHLEFCTDNAAMIAALAGAPGSLVRVGADDLDVQPDLVVGLP